MRQRALPQFQLQPGPPLRAQPLPAAGHVPDAEIHWLSTDTSPYPGQVWAVEVELTAKSR